ncbi:MAG: hypothetical protein IPG77_04935 [Betaproteobacteria bacterium]|nr:hypothetical protein [Betaproteobacteria bacterium]
MSILSKVLAQHTAICGASKRTLKRVQRDTLQKARAKCIEKVRANKAWHNDNTLQKPDTVVAQDTNGNFSVGVKYGNRYLLNVFNGGKDTFIENVPESVLNDVFDGLVEMIETGECDAAIKDAMAANLAMHAKH